MDRERLSLRRSDHAFTVQIDGDSFAVHKTLPSNTLKMDWPANSAHRQQQQEDQLRDGIEVIPWTRKEETCERRSGQQERGCSIQKDFRFSLCPAFLLIYRYCSR